MFATPRVAIGGEWAQLGTIVAPGGPPRAQIEERHREHAAFATLRVRAFEGAGAALDIAGGIGALFQRRETTFRLDPDATRRSTRTSPAFVVRIEAPLRLARDLAVGPTAGFYFLRRDVASDPRLDLSRTGPSTRVSAGVAAHFLW